MYHGKFCTNILWRWCGDRRHRAALMCSIATEVLACCFCLLFPQPCFDMFYSHVQKLITTDVTLGQMERFSLLEALVLIINQFKDHAKQKAFLDQMLGPLITDWTSEEISQSVTPYYAFGFFLFCTITLFSSSFSYFSVCQSGEGLGFAPDFCWCWSSGAWTW